MKTLRAFLRKDIKLLTSDTFLALLLMLVVAFCTIIAYSMSSGYIDLIDSTPMELKIEQLLFMQKMTLSRYWYAVISIESLVILLISTLAFSAEKETGMFKYILAYRCGTAIPTISKFVSLLPVCFIFSLVPAVCFIITFSAIASNMLDLTTIFLSMIFPTLIFVTLTSIGLLFSTLSKKKHMAVVSAVMIFILLTLIFDLSASSGYEDVKTAYYYAYGDYGYLTNDDMRELFPNAYSFLIALNPLSMRQGINLLLNIEETGGGMFNEETFALFDTGTYMLIGLALTIVFLLASTLSLRRERKECHITFDAGT